MNQYNYPTTILCGQGALTELITRLQTRPPKHYLIVTDRNLKSTGQPGEMGWLNELDFRTEYPNVRPCGVMGMATFTDEESVIRKEFQSLKAIFQTLKAGPFNDHQAFTEISMGMSSDYQIALEEGATMVRVGSLIFGARD